MAEKSASAKIHRRLNHPVIDADGHWIEFEPTLLDYLDAVAGSAMANRARRIVATETCPARCDVRDAVS